MSRGTSLGKTCDRFYDDTIIIYYAAFNRKIQEENPYVYISINRYTYTKAIRTRVD